MNEQLACFVLAGGAGTRLWPLSRPDKPKQFHALSGGGSMLAQTVHRLKGRLLGAAPIFVMAAERHADLVHRECAGTDLAGGGVLFEPRGRNTAAAVALATLKTLDAFGDALVLVVPSDHEISTVGQFWETVESGVPAACAGRLVLFGIVPRYAETGYGYVEAGERRGDVFDVWRFIEKPDLETAEDYLREGDFFWNAGIFLFRAATMRRAFLALQPAIWSAVEQAFQAAVETGEGLQLPASYGDVAAISFDRAIVERASNLALVPAGFKWRDLGSWASLLAAGQPDGNGNVIAGDVEAVDCRNSYLRSEGQPLSVVGADSLVVVATPDAVLVTQANRSRDVSGSFDAPGRSHRLPGKNKPISNNPPEWGYWRRRVRHWLFEEAMPLWASIGVDERHGGFHEAVGFDTRSLGKPKRMRTMARQVYAYARAGRCGWEGLAGPLVDHGLAFMAGHGRTQGGGWARTLDVDGAVIDAAEDSYDHACVLLALAEAHRSGHPDALSLGLETFAFLDAHLRVDGTDGYLAVADDGGAIGGPNPHMHLLEAFLAWYAATGDRACLDRAAQILDLFAQRFFDAESWMLDEEFDAAPAPRGNGCGERIEPGHHFEWAWLIVDLARRAGRPELVSYARKLYATATACGLNRITGLAFGSMSRTGVPLDTIARSWPQAEAIKAAIALDRTGAADLKPEIEQRVGRLFTWHLDPAPTGLWIDRIGGDGRPLASEVPASILYHLVSALTAYLDYSAGADQYGLATSPVST